MELTDEQFMDNGSTFGGNLVDIPAPHRRRWPNDVCPRPVKVEISSWVGRSAGAKHYYARVTEENNPIWDSRPETIGKRAGEPRGWTCPWEDEEGEGRSFRDDDLLNEQSAISWATHIIATHFAGNGYVVEWSDRLGR